MVELPAPSRGWEPDESARAFGYVSFLFGLGDVEDPGALRPLAAWRRGERGHVRIFRRVDRRTGTPEHIPTRTEWPMPKELAGGALWYDMGSKGTQFYWVTAGSVVVEAEVTPLGAGPAVAAYFRPWAVKAAAALATPRLRPTSP
jgi:hypothetical protein